MHKSVKEHYSNSILTISVVPKQFYKKNWLKTPVKKIKAAQAKKDAYIKKIVCICALSQTRVLRFTVFWHIKYHIIYHILTIKNYCCKYLN